MRSKEEGGIEEEMRRRKELGGREKVRREEVRREEVRSREEGGGEEEGEGEEEEVRSREGGIEEEGGGEEVWRLASLYAKFHPPSSSKTEKASFTQM